MIAHMDDGVSESKVPLARRRTRVPTAPQASSFLSKFYPPPGEYGRTRVKLSDQQEAYLH